MDSIKSYSNHPQVVYQWSCPINLMQPFNL
ncbi:hypothetical protein LINPERPRIM_LOCUS20049 [Linum perenne]